MLLHKEQNGYANGKNKTTRCTTFYKTSFVVFAWYLFSVISNNLSKKIMQKNPIPVTLMLFQFFVTVMLLSILMQYKRKYKRVPFTWTIFKLVVPLSIGHISAHFLGKLSYHYLSVSFVHTIKATSPIFTICVSYFMLSQTFPISVVVSLLPIIVGVSLASLSEYSVQWPGFLSALASTVIFSGQNIYSKILFKKGAIDSTNLLLYTSSLGFMLVFPIWYFTEFGTLVTAFEDGNLEPGMFIGAVALNSFSHFMQSFMAFSFLTLVTPLTYSVANTLKRIFVIVSSILYFGNTPTATNAIGMTLAILGVFIYNRAKQIRAVKNVTLPTHCPEPNVGKSTTVVKV